MNLDFLISRAGLRLAEVDVTVTGLRLAKNGGPSLAAQSAERIDGSMTLALADLTAAVDRVWPELRAVVAPPPGVDIVGGRPADAGRNLN